MLIQALWWFVETTLIAGLLAVLASLCGRLRGIDASTRHLVWLIVLVKLLFPPLFNSPWTWTRPELGVHLTQSTRNLIAPETPSIPEASGLAGRSEPSSADDEPFRALLASSDAAPAIEPGAPDPAVDAPGPPAEIMPAPPASRGPADLDRRSEPSRMAIVLGSIPVLGWFLIGWGAITLVRASLDLIAIIRFQHRLRLAVPAPAWLAAESEELASRLGIAAPEILALPGLCTPVVWCLARPRLLVPAHLIKSLDAAGWRGILAHELAHLHRGDHWVSRLEVLASWLWWWNPVYWLARRRIDAEAELACDAWVVRLLPDERMTYAEVLFEVCSKFSLTGSPTPALGVAGSGRFLERRLHMILDHPTERRRPFPLMLAICLLALLALPSWTRSNSIALAVMDTEAGKSQDKPPADVATASSDDDDDRDDEADDADDDDDVDDEADDADDDDADDEADDDADDDESQDRSKADKAYKGGRDVDEKAIEQKIEKEIESVLGPDFEKKIEAQAEKLAKQMEKQFGKGSEFAKSMEAFGKEMERKFGDGSEFAKKMESLGKDMEKKFGPGSDFAKKMESLGKDMEKKFGPGSDFAKKMEQKFGENSELARKMKEAVKQEEKARHDAAKQEEKARHAEARESADKDAHSSDERKARELRRQDRIRALEDRINGLMKELKELKASESE
ncbi:MAG: M56 family metallopeptidase [Isosphaeraceae bacterium]